MSLPEIVKKYQSMKELSERQIPNLDPQVHRVTLANIRKAKRDLGDVVTEYRKEALRGNALLMFVNSDKADEFLNIAKEEFGAYTANINDFAEELSKDVHETYYKNHAINNTIFTQLEAVFNLLAMDMGIEMYDAIYYDHKYAGKLNNKEDLISLINRSYSEGLGGEVFALFYTHLIAGKAIEDGFTGKLIPIVINTNGNETLAKKITEDSGKIGINSVVLNIKAKEIDKELVEKELVKAKKHLNKRGR
jgi:hypothetical protein